MLRTLCQFLALVCTIWTFQSSVANGQTCSNVFAEALTAENLGASWQNANWRKDLVPPRYYNYDAVDRVIADPELHALGVRWKALNELPGANGKFMDATYQYLVYLADIRIKFRVPIGGIPDKPKVQLAVLTTMFDAYDAHLDTTPIVTEVSTYLKQYVHLDAGLEIQRSQDAFDFMNKRVIPAQMNLLTTLAFSKK